MHIKNILILNIKKTIIFKTSLTDNWVDEGKKRKEI